MRSIESIESERYWCSTQRSAPGRASRERSQSPMLSASSRAASGWLQGSSGSTVRESASSSDVEPREVLVVGLVHPGRAVAHRHALVGAPGIGQVERGVARLQREPQLGHQAGVGALPLGGQLAAELDRPAVVEPLLLHPAAGALARLQHQHVGAAGREVAGTGEPGQPRPHHHHVPF